MRKRAAARQNDILTVLKSREKPMTAYQILEELQASEPDIAPPTVYRTLSALTDQGRAHKLESIKAFAYGLFRVPTPSAATSPGFVA